MPKAVNRYAEHGSQIGEFGATITAPAERLISDIIVHKELDFALRPELFVFGRIFAHGQPTGTSDDPSLLPIKQPTVELSGSPPRVNTTLVPKYPQIVQKVYDRMGWNVILRVPLPERQAK